MIGEIVSHLNSVDIHRLRNTTTWLAAAVDFHYRKRHPTHTTCRGEQKLPALLNRLAMPAVYPPITHLILTGGKSTKLNTLYPAADHMFKLPRLNTLILNDIDMDGIFTIQILSYHQGKLNNLSFHNVELGTSGEWEAILWLIMKTMKLEMLQTQDLCYISNFDCLPCEIYLPMPDRIDGLEGAKGRRMIKNIMVDYFHQLQRRRYEILMARTQRLFEEADVISYDDV